MLEENELVFFKQRKTRYYHTTQGMGKKLKCIYVNEKSNRITFSQKCFVIHHRSY